MHFTFNSVKVNDNSVALEISDFGISNMNIYPEQHVLEIQYFSIVTC